MRLFSYLDGSVATLDDCQTQQQQAPALKRQCHLFKIHNTCRCWCPPRLSRLLFFFINLLCFLSCKNPFLSGLRRMEDARQVSRGRDALSLWGCALGKFSPWKPLHVTYISSTKIPPTEMDPNTLKPCFFFFSFLFHVSMLLTRK